MDPIQKVFQQLVDQNQTTSPYKLCSICNEPVPAIEVDVMGTKRWVQPRCKCEVEAFDAEQKEFQNFQREREVRELFSISQVGDRYLQAGFKNFQMRLGSENVFKVSQYYVDKFETFGRESLLLWGEPGNGKTHLAAAIHNALRAKGLVVVFVSMPDLLSKIKATFNRNNKESEEQILRALSICDLLIIDDLGAEKTSDWVEETIFKIIDNRYRRNKPILATSNMAPKELPEQIGKRSNDRIVEMMQPVENKATSYRREHAKDRFGQFRAFLQENEGA